MIPVFINVRNRLTTTRILADQVARLPDAVPILIDNASDWEPLLDWYSETDYEVIRLSENVGHHAPWLRVIPSAGEFAKRWGELYYVVTDCDLDIAECPLDLLDVLREPFAWGEGIAKSGLSLRIDDLPEWQSSVVQWESRWWKRPTRGGRFYSALVDTTFCMFDCQTPRQRAMRVIGVPSVRSAPPYTARHIPWYLDGNNLDAENVYYFATANESNSWRPKGQSLIADYASPIRLGIPR